MSKSNIEISKIINKNNLNNEFENIKKREQITNEQDLLSKYKLAKPFENFREEEKRELFKRLDNFIQAIHLTPNTFPVEILTLQLPLLRLFHDIYNKMACLFL